MQLVLRLNILTMLALGVLLIAALIHPALAETSTPVVSANSFWYVIWGIIQPIATTIATIVGPVLAVWLSAKLASFLNISDEVKRQEIEEKLRKALHESALNGLKYAFSIHGKESQGLPSLLKSEIINTAVRYVMDKNPDATAAFHLNDTSLKEIIISKIPDVKAILDN